MNYQDYYTKSTGKEGSDEASAINEINIVSEPLFTVSVDNVLVSTIACSSNGRIFYAGKDGHLYEIDYQVFAIHLIIGADLSIMIIKLCMI